MRCFLIIYVIQERKSSHFVDSSLYFLPPAAVSKRGVGQNAGGPVQRRADLPRLAHRSRLHAQNRDLEREVRLARVQHIHKRDIRSPDHIV